MKWAKYKHDFSDDPRYGIGLPDDLIASRGDYHYGACHIGDKTPQDWCIAQVNDDFNFEGLERWQMTELTVDEALELIQTAYPASFKTETGSIAIHEVEPQIQ